MNMEAGGPSETSLPCPKIHGIILLSITVGVIKNHTLELQKAR